MTIFDLLFIVLVLTALGTLITAAITAVRGHGSRAVSILRRLGISAAVYVVVVMVVGLLSPQRVLAVGDAWCFDDWCLSVEKVTRTPAPPQAVYTVSIRIFSRARRVSQSAKGAWIYVIDGSGNRYAPEPDLEAVPLDAMLEPGESISTSRVFRVPADAAGLGLITGHGGPVWLPNLIIGDAASIFHKPTFMRLP